MKLTEAIRSRVTIPILLLGLLMLGAACGSGGEPEAESVDEPTATPMPEITLDELVASAEEKLAAISTVKFEMVDEKESGQEFFGMTPEERGGGSEVTGRLQDVRERGGIRVSASL